MTVDFEPRRVSAPGWARPRSDASGRISERTRAFFLRRVLFRAHSRLLGRRALECQGDCKPFPIKALEQPRWLRRTEFAEYDRQAGGWRNRAFLSSDQWFHMSRSSASFSSQASRSTGSGTFAKETGFPRSSKHRLTARGYGRCAPIRLRYLTLAVRSRNRIGSRRRYCYVRTLGTDHCRLCLLAAEAPNDGAGERQPLEPEHPRG